EVAMCLHQTPPSRLGRLPLEALIAVALLAVAMPRLAAEEPPPAVRKKIDALKAAIKDAWKTDFQAVNEMNPQLTGLRADYRREEVYGRTVVAYVKVLVGPPDHPYIANWRNDYSQSADVDVGRAAKGRVAQYDFGDKKGTRVKYGAGWIV